MNNRRLDDPIAAAAAAAARRNAVLIQPHQAADGRAAGAERHDGAARALVSRRGVLTFGVVAALAGEIVVRGTSGAEAAKAKGQFQINWHLCVKCRGLWFAVDTSGLGGVCPYGGKHIWDGSYQLRYDMKVKGEQRNWRYCANCAGLWFAGDGSDDGVCPAGGGHSQTGSFDYSVRRGKSSNNYESHWRYCAKCAGLWYAGDDYDPLPGVCPADHGLHSGHPSGKFCVRIFN